MIIIVHVSTWIDAAVEPAATPAAVNPNPATARGTATAPTTTPTPTAAINLFETMGSEISQNIFHVCFMN